MTNIAGKLKLSLIILLIAIVVISSNITAFAMDTEYYVVYDENGDEICYKGEDVAVGDKYITWDNKCYKIIEMDEKTKKCKAMFLEDIELPVINSNSEMVSVLVEIDKSAGLYFSHNDESYIPNDGTSSIYGVGGIHDVGNAFADALRNEGFRVYVDESLHLPHDIDAYKRSRNTADGLIKQYDVDVLFDIHRDGAPRSAYDTVVAGEPMSKVRMVVGQSNPNFEENYQFALEIKALADKWYPGLVKDIYLGLGRYNQDLSGQALLFEFGSEEVEKELAIKSTIPIANVINGVLQQRAVAGATTTGYITDLIEENSTGTASTIFKLLLFVGGIIIFFILGFLFNAGFRNGAINFFSPIFKGIYITRKK